MSKQAEPGKQPYSKYPKKPSAFFFAGILARINFVLKQPRMLSWN